METFLSETRSTLLSGRGQGLVIWTTPSEVIIHWLNTDPTSAILKIDDSHLVSIVLKELSFLEGRELAAADTKSFGSTNQEPQIFASASGDENEEEIISKNKRSYEGETEEHHEQQRQLIRNCTL